MEPKIWKILHQRKIDIPMLTQSMDSITMKKKIKFTVSLWIRRLTEARVLYSLTRVIEKMNENESGFRFWFHVGFTFSSFNSFYALDLSCSRLWY